MLKTETENIQSEHLCVYSKPHMGISIISTKYDKTSVLSHIIICFIDTTQFSTTHFRNFFLAILIGLLSNTLLMHRTVIRFKRRKKCYK